jgi:hypothetical protein
MCMTCLCPSGGFVHAPHCSEAHDVDASIGETHERTDEGQEGCVADERVVGCALDLENREDGAAEVGVSKLRWPAFA